MPEETFESVFTIGVDTSSAIENINALIKSLGQAEKKLAETLKAFQASVSININSADLKGLENIKIPQLDIKAGPIVEELGKLNSLDLSEFRFMFQRNVNQPIVTAIRDASDLVGVLQSLPSKLPAIPQPPEFAWGPQPPPEPIIPAYVPGEQSGYIPSAQRWYSAEQKRFTTKDVALEEIARSGKSFQEIATISQEELAKIPKAVREVVQVSLEQFNMLSDKVVGRSIIPDMVRDVNDWLSRIKVPPQVLSELDAVASKIRGITRSSVVPAYVQGEQSSYQPDVGRGRSAASGEIVDAISSDYVADVTTQKQPLQVQPSRTIIDEAPVIERYIDGEMVERTEQITELYTKFSDAGEAVAEVVSNITTKFDGQGKVISRVTKETEVQLENGKQITRIYEEMGEAANKSSQSQVRAANSAGRAWRHVTWILQGIAIWKVIGFISDMGREMVSTFSEIEQSAVRMAFVAESSVDRVYQSMKSAATDVAKYGVGPAESASTQLTMTRFGVQSPEFMEQSAQLAMVAQMDLGESTRDLLEIQRMWNLSLEDTGAILDTLATVYANTPADIKEIIDVMREGPAAAERLGVSFQEYMSIIASTMSYLPTQTPSGLSGLLGRMLTRMYQPQISQEIARQYGVSLTDPETLRQRSGIEVLDELSQKYRELQTETEQAAMAELIAGARGGQSWQDAKVLLDNWTGGIRDAQMEMRTFGDLSEQVMNTNKQAVQELHSQWQLFIQTIKAGPVIQDILGGVSTLLRGMNWASAKELSGRKDGEDKPWYRKIQDWYGEYIMGFATGHPSVSSDQAGQEIVDKAGEAAQQIEAAGHSAGQALEKGAEALEKGADTVGLVFLEMLRSGWSPSPSILDLSKYTSEQIAMATKQSQADQQREIVAYRRFLEQQGLGGEAIEEALANFAEKLQLNLQFVRLPGGEIRLMEGRDLLFYLSKIEENTRPLEGIWNVPEGMRVWVPIESTFYGKWRQRESEGQPGDQQVSLDASAFDAATNKFGGYVDTFGSTASSAANDMARSISEVANELIESKYAEPEWAQWTSPGFEDRVRRLEDLLTSKYAEPEWYTFEDQTDLTNQPVVPDTDGLLKLLDQIGEMLYLPTIMKDQSGETRNGALPWQGMERQLEKLAPPLDVNVQEGSISTGVQTGTIATGMPSSMSSMAVNLMAMRSTAIAQLAILAAIARNTATAPTVNVTVDGSTSVATVSARQTNDALMREWLLSHGVYESPI